MARPTSTILVVSGLLQKPSGIQEKTDFWPVPCLLTALALFGHLTTASRKTAHAAIRPVAAETQSVGGLAFSLHALTTIPAMLAVVSVVSFVLAATTLVYGNAGLSHHPSRTLPMPTALQGLPIQTNLHQLAWQAKWPTRVFPRQPQGLPPDQQGWFSYGPMGAEATLLPAEAQRFFTQMKRDFYLLIPTGFSIDFAYAGPLADKPGPDVLIQCVPGATLPDFFAVNRSNQTEVLNPLCIKNDGRGGIMLGFDLSSLPRTFNPARIRIVGIDGTVSDPCFGVHRVLARIHNQAGAYR